MEGSERSVGSWWGCCGEGFENSGEREASGCLEAEEEEEEGGWRPGGKMRKALAARAKDEDGLVDAALASEERLAGKEEGPALSV